MELTPSCVNDTEEIPENKVWSIGMKPQCLWGEASFQMSISKVQPLLPVQKVMVEFSVK